MRRFIQLRDRECRQPACSVPGHRCETDHIIAHYKGGPTSQNNLILLCKKHNLLRQRSAWSYDHVKPGILAFRTPTGHTHTTKPEPMTCGRFSGGSGRRRGRRLDCLLR
ncbi:HNH endonuclease [Kibdelosporangium philippinense]|uniref:HNH endonuclease n=1 Tax=Kibdelosporangium philippinense TaxID=211113 RepID=A0ABS8ZVH0_9PSEU|nr:HNH endonuclease [Kibdelosporangium philippinense]